ncbi:hypothetical protein TWF481_002429 [Arthrobotrys musiformis]|uniref:DNA-binding TFAR19-related protein n=1 Tax=Arthrobotrys musiformis TaxID=47236 RepID=A0AAV9VV92_9PEZI
MEDDDLQKIRQARLAQLQQEQGSSGGGQSDQQNAQREAETEARKSMLSQILTPEANDRLGRIALVRADRARDLENRLIMMARSGQVRQRITDTELRGMLESVSGAESKKEEGKVVFRRRGGGFDDDEDDWD